jgi:hypothetical protein
MAACERCWRDAHFRVMHLGGSVIDHYHDLLRERTDRPCVQCDWCHDWFHPDDITAGLCLECRHREDREED